MQISRYFASIGFDIDAKSVRKVDSVLDQMEKKLRKFSSFGKGFSFGISNFLVDQKKLNMVLGNSLDLASKSTKFEVSNFVVNDRNLQAAMLRASRRVGATALIQPNGQVGARAQLSPVEWDRRQKVLGQTALSQHQRQLELAQLRRSAASSNNPRGRIGVGMGGIYGGLSNIAAPAIALGLGGYGLSNLNQRNQQVVSAQLQSQAVVQQAGGTAEQGSESFQWLRNQGNRIGFNYLEASGDYNKLLSGLTGAGMSIAQGQGVFKGFSELSRVNKLDRTTQSRLFRALSQVAGKDQLMSEELTGQIAEALPGGVSLFAEAYQRQTGKSLGLTGSASIKELLAAMKGRKVKGDILTYAADIAAERAAPSLDAASRASQAEQARYQNSVNDLAVVASNAGVEEGFARIFRTLNAGLSESNSLVEYLSEGFNNATKWADDLALWPQSFVRALEGKDSLVGDWLGVGKTEQLKKDWADVKVLWEQISQIKPTDLFGEFLPTLQATTREMAAILYALAEFRKWKDGKGTTEESTDVSTPWAAFKSFVSNTGLNIDRAQKRGEAVYGNPNSPYFKDPEGYDRDMAQGNNPYDPVNQYNQLQDSWTAAEDWDNPQAIKTSVIPKLSFDKVLNLKDQYSALTPMSALGVFDNPNWVNPYEDLSEYAPKTPKEQEEWNKEAAMAAQSTETNNTQTNEFNIEINVDAATLGNLDLESQAQAMAEAFSSQLGTMFEQVQVNFPTKE